MTHPPAQPAPATRRLASLWPPVALAALFLAALAVSWRAWPDVLVDFGRELYLPWQVSLGQVLYRDLAHLFGPLSVYYHAALFRLFGASYTVLIASNTIIFAALLSLWYDLTARAASRPAAWMSTAVAIGLFGFGQYLEIGNYNFISPYAHEVTHGLFLATLMIHQLGRYALERRRRALVAAGVALGLVCLTKSEVFLAALAAAACFFILPAGAPGWRQGRRLGLFLGAAIAPPVAWAAFLAVQMPAAAAAQAMLEPWRVLLNSGAHRNAFYVAVMGLDNPARNLLAMAVEFVCLLALSGGAGLIARCSADQTARRWARIMRIGWMIAAAGAILAPGPYRLGRSLPILALVALAALVWEQRVRPNGKTVSLALWSVLALGLLGRMPLRATFVHYGFYLALPTSVLLVVLLFWRLPAWLDSRAPGSGRAAQKLVLSFCVLFMAFYAARSILIYSHKQFQIGQGADQFRAWNPAVDARTEIVARTLEWLIVSLDPSETFVALPEGVMLNYLTRRANPTRYTNFMPPELAAYGEPAVVAELSAHPPDYVLIVHKTAAEYGYRFFGQDSDYGAVIMAWVEQNYSPICQFGARPLVDAQFGIEVRARRSLPAGAAPPCDSNAQEPAH